LSLFRKSNPAEVTMLTLPRLLGRGSFFMGRPNNTSKSWIKTKK
jgi:hypothetical protein